MDWFCILELQTGGRKQSSNSLRQLESLALGRETDLYTAKLLEECLKQARKALLRKETPPKKTGLELQTNSGKPHHDKNEKKDSSDDD